MNPHLDALQPYPFEKLRRLKDGITPETDKPHISLSIGEPKHQAPQFVLDALIHNLTGYSQYPLTKGIPELRNAIADWLSGRYAIERSHFDAEQHVLPVAGTREALFSFVQACVTPGISAKVLMPNPFYQIYEGAAILAGATPFFLNCTEHNNFIPEVRSLPQQVLGDCQILFICSPGNPTGSVMSLEQLQDLIKLADEHNFIIASDECYSELYFDETNPPAGLLQACASMGRYDFHRCVVFHSLSKRSNLPGLRSGFVAGDASILENYLLYRTYEGCALPVPTQLASISAWQDEKHVKQNRELYRQKFSAVLPILQAALPASMPDASFYVWLKTPCSDLDFARELYRQKNVTVLPGRYLARDTDNGNPGEHFVRIALVATEEECLDAAQRIADFVRSLTS